MNGVNVEDIGMSTVDKRIARGCHVSAIEKTGRRDFGCLLYRDSKSIVRILGLLEQSRKVPTDNYAEMLEDTIVQWVEQAGFMPKKGTFPIDTTKTRLQIQGQVIDPRHVQLRYNGMVDCFVKISQQEGVPALYRGIWPAVLRQATYGTIKFGTYYSMKEWIAVRRADGGTKEHLPTNTFCAAFAGGFSSAIANPTDVLKVRMQVGEERRNIVRCFVSIYRLEGVRGLWRGVAPTSQRAAVIAAVELPVYDACKKRFTPALGDSPANHFASSLLASLGSAVASTPLDVIRTRLMNQRKMKDHIAKPNEILYKGTVDCFLQTVRNEGFLALYKGFIPTWLRMGPWNIIFFITYEQLKHLY